MVNKKIGKGKLVISGKAVVLGAKKEYVGPEGPGQTVQGPRGTTWSCWWTQVPA